MIIQDNYIEAEEGYMLTNNETYTSSLYLGIYDSPSNWHEIPIEEVPQDEQFTENSLPF